MTTSRTTAGEQSTARVLGLRRRRAAVHPPGPGAGGTRNRAARPRSVRIGWAVSGAAALSLLAAACGGGGYGTGAAAAPPAADAGQDGGDQYGGAAATSSGARPAAVVDVRTSALGRTLVDGQGRTLYLFEADGAGRSECAGGCATAWPPYLGVGAPRAGAGVTGSLLGTTTRADGAVQVTYGGHPLYYYAGDAGPGDETGQGLDQFGAKWFVLGTDGAAIDQD